jgi:alkylmercury lyase
MSGQDMAAKTRDVHDRVMAYWDNPEGRWRIQVGARIVARILQTDGPLTRAEVNGLCADLLEPGQDTVERLAQTGFLLEHNDRGDVVSMALGPNPNRRAPLHAVQLSGRRVYAWCAEDTMLFPIVMEQRAEVISVCPVTRRIITLTVTPTGVEHLDPPTARMTLAPIHGRNLREEFCDRVVFTADTAAAEAFIGGDPEPVHMPAAAGFGVAKALADMF